MGKAFAQSEKGVIRYRALQNQFQKCRVGVGGGVVVKFASTALALLLFLALPARAQIAGGSISGTVTGESGAVMPDVRISVKEVGTGLVRTSTSNTAGLYSVPDLAPESFEMSVSASGFTTQLWTTISVTAERRERVLNVVMHPGDPQQIVRIAAPPALASEACPGGMREAPNSSTVRDTPLNGR